MKLSTISESIKVDELAMPKKVNKEAEQAIEKANSMGFDFAIDQMEKGGNYQYKIETPDNGLWESLTYKLYKVSDKTWKVVVKPAFSPTIQDAASKLGGDYEALWFTI